MGLTLGMTLKFYPSVTKELRVGKFRGLISMFVEVTREKMVGCFFAHPLPHHEKGKGKASPGGKRSPISLSKCS